MVCFECFAGTDGGSLLPLPIFAEKCWVTVTWELGVTSRALVELECVHGRTGKHTVFAGTRDWEFLVKTFGIPTGKVVQYPRKEVQVA
jgi:hypothetical protein